MNYKQEDLKMLRKVAGLTQEEVAKAAGMSRQHYSEIERCIHAVNVALFNRILDVILRELRRRGIFFTALG